MGQPACLQAPLIGAAHLCVCRTCRPACLRCARGRLPAHLPGLHTAKCVDCTPSPCQSELGLPLSNCYWLSHCPSPCHVSVGRWPSNPASCRAQRRVWRCFAQPAVCKLVRCHLSVQRCGKHGRLASRIITGGQAQRSCAPACQAAPGRWSACCGRSIPSCLRQHLVLVLALLAHQETRPHLRGRRGTKGGVGVLGAVA
jgi:hypothetical protein